LESFASACRAHLYLLTGDEIPFGQDGLRDGEGIRHQMHQWFEEALPRTGVPWVSIRGSREERLACSMAAVRSLGRWL
jgi:nicotinamide riboside kinase